ncbi:MAG: hypothetical protein H0T79_06720 [Deltaproteobacteria bacterium]|nr:hypothetical protein [Deltaproteobacteria bacterium]
MLGHIALASDDVERAKAHLAASVATRGSPQMNSFGPDFDLAAALLARGERDAVLRYLDTCTRFWKHDGGRLARWTQAIVRGESPTLARNHFEHDSPPP